MQGPAAPGPPAGPGTPSDDLNTAGTPLHCCWPENMRWEGNGKDKRVYHSIRYEAAVELLKLNLNCSSTLSIFTEHNVLGWQHSTFPKLREPCH